VEPRERAIIPLDGFRLSRSLAKAVRQDRYRVSCDEAFAAVISECAAPREEHAESWISHRIEASYLDLHETGHAHSIECWLPDRENGERLAGGLYGVAFDRVFCGESMFSRADNASKVALAGLVAALGRAGFLVLDCQFLTGHLASLGARTMAQKNYLARIGSARGAPTMALPQAVASFVAEGMDEGAPLPAGRGRALGAAGLSPGRPVDAPASSPGKRIAQSLTQTS